MRAACLALLAIACSTTHEQPRRVPAPTCSYLGADWLDRPEREQREQPDRVLDALKLTKDMVVADVGAGTGYFTVRLARRVAKVHATDLQPEMLRMLDARLGTQKLTNVALHKAGDHDAALPAGCCDLVLRPVSRAHRVHVRRFERGASTGLDMPRGRRARWLLT